MVDEPTPTTSSAGPEPQQPPKPSCAIQSTPSASPLGSATPTDEAKKALAAGDAEVILDEAERPTPDVLQNIVNFRDVGKNFNADCGKQVLKEGNFFRSGRLDDATTSDLALLTDMFHIKTVVDLRHDEKGRAESDMADHLVSTFPASAINEQTRLAELVHFLPPPSAHHKAQKEDAKDNDPSVDSSFEFDHDESDDEDEDDEDADSDEVAASKSEVESLAGSRPRITYCVDFAGSSYRWNSVWVPLKWQSKLKVMYLIATGQKPKVVELVGNEVIRPHGLIGLNESFLRYCGPEIAHALRLLSVPSHYPLLVHCTQGKDRTGLVVSLALHCAGAPLPLITLDYARTQRGIERQRDVMVDEMAKTGLSSSFADAPPETIQQVFEFLDREYGGASKYLSKHGFGKRLQRRLAACLRLAGGVAEAEAGGV
ncbi:hypothetical protein HDU87_002324 [Geranomyces variabilis]|uniref:Tyrosine specific protein phosphatases domain-containing protein n=1 Tax=Geranomyces variabilis TaxID=109894 RepID=A0AAD5TM25_9FUNG|nr:hypothetical protein HDU87_002324 [Geranomyces variabilis]